MGENNIDIVVTESHAVIRNCLCWLGHVCPGDSGTSLKT